MRYREVVVPLEADIRLWDGKGYDAEAGTGHPLVARYENGDGVYGLVSLPGGSLKVFPGWAVVDYGSGAVTVGEAEEVLSRFEPVDPPKAADEEPSALRAGKKPKALSEGSK